MLFYVKGAVLNIQNYNIAANKYLLCKDIVKQWGPEQRMCSLFSGRACMLVHVTVKKRRYFTYWGTVCESRVEVIPAHCFIFFSISSTALSRFAHSKGGP